MHKLDPGLFHLFSMEGTHLLIGFRGGLYLLDDGIYAALCRSEGSPDLRGESLSEFDRELAAIERKENDTELSPEIPGRTLRALCLNVTSDCNMHCSYCFARKKDTPRDIMDFPTAKRAIDFLFEHSRQGASLQVDFFGGEPLLNFEVIGKTVEHGRKKARKSGKEIKFTVTTNATVLTDAIASFLDSEDFSVILSIDGPRELHDRHRPFLNGRPSWEEVLASIKRFLEKRRYRNYYLRGTFTPSGLELTKIAEFFISHGFRNFSLEPARGKDEEVWAVNISHLTVLEREYEALARMALTSSREKRPFEFFHFKVYLDSPLCAARRLTGCGAGVEYLSITPGGEIFPCHQLQEIADFSMGSLFSPRVSPRFDELRQTFLDATVLSKKPCRTCWARYYCSGGCHANALLFNGDILKPDELGCALQKKRLECSLWLKARERQQAGAHEKREHIIENGIVL
ncbi:MAG: SPASM domain-containing protein [Candidatus Eremiobacteraeota bacterium]|nr:SPASM domain-containing protein [Candidatus Eremiobacteraeota bacterium]